VDSPSDSGLPLDPSAKRDSGLPTTTADSERNAAGPPMSPDPQLQNSSTNSTHLDPSISELLSRISPAALRQLGGASNNSPPEGKRADEDLGSHKDPRMVVFASLSSNPNLAQRLSQLHQQQRILEQQLWDERTGITRSFQGEMDVLSQKQPQVQGAENSGSMQSEIERIEAAHLAALNEHSAEKVIPKWDALVTEQRSQFESFLDHLSQNAFTEVLEVREVASWVEEYIKSHLLQ